MAPFLTSVIDCSIIVLPARNLRFESLDPSPCPTFFRPSRSIHPRRTGGKRPHFFDRTTWVKGIGNGALTSGNKLKHAQLIFTVIILQWRVALFISTIQIFASLEAACLEVVNKPLFEILKTSGISNEWFFNRCTVHCSRSKLFPEKNKHKINSKKM